MAEASVAETVLDALQRFQEQMEGEAEKAGLETEEEVAAWVTASRREQNP